MNGRRLVAYVGAAMLALPVGLFVANGLDSGWKVPEVGSGGGKERATPVHELRVMSLNVAKAAFHHGGLSFASEQSVCERLDRIASAIETERCDLVYLSEVVIEAGPVPVNQAEYLARRCGFAYFATGENYSFGLPFFRIRSGNALLSQFPLRPRENVQLAGARPFWNPNNNRRTLWCDVEIAGHALLTASIRNDSFDIENNLLQTREILRYIDGRQALIAGDFNAEPHTPPMLLLNASESFAGLVDGPPTFPASAPRRRIDYVLVPTDWTIVEQHLVDTGVSDHLAVVAIIRLPSTEPGSNR